MGRRGRGEESGDVQRVCGQFATWRTGRKPGERIPVRLWKQAVKLAKKHGVSRTATALKLDYYSLKKRLDQNKARVGSSDAAFVELPAPISLPMAGEYSIEFEDGSGASMRITIKGGGLPDLMALSRSFWNAD